MRLIPISIVILIACLPGASTQAHELWFQPAGGSASVARLTFGDSPAPGEAERVAEIAHTKVWGDGQPLEVKRLPDGLEARTPTPKPSVLSAYADRGVINYMGDSFVITLAAYAQSQPAKPDEVLKLGLGDDQLRLLLVAGEGGAPVVRVSWKDKPVPDLAVQVFRNPGESPTVVEMNGRGEMPCPSLAKGPVSVLAVVMDRTPGTRDGRKYSHVRYKATLAIDGEAARSLNDPSPADGLARVKEIHGDAGPWAVAGYRIGQRALKELGLPRHSFSLRVVHHCPAQVQYSCIADGLQAATGASPGKLNLKVEEAAVSELKTVIEDRRSHRILTFVLQPRFVDSIRDVPLDRFDAEARRVAEMPDEAIFALSETASKAK